MLEDIKNKEVICIVCPKGCHIKSSLINGEWSFVGHQCLRGPKYAIEEITSPKRILTSTIVIKDALDRRLPIHTKNGLPKELIFEVMKEINKVVVIAPVDINDVVISNVLNTGVNIFASKSVKKIKQ